MILALDGYHKKTYNSCMSTENYLKNIPRRKHTSKKIIIRGGRKCPSPKHGRFSPSLFTSSWPLQLPQPSDSLGDDELFASSYFEVFNPVSKGAISETGWVGAWFETGLGEKESSA